MKSEMPIATWTIKDILIVVSCVFSGGLIFYISTLILFGDNKTTFQLSRYVGSLLMAFFPLFWIKKKYGLSKEALGLKKENLSLLKIVSIGILPAITYSILVQFTPLRYGSAPTSLKISEHYIDLILLPVSISGFASLVLAPVGEEIFGRGFIYGYLRKKLGVVFGLLLQALLFSLLHFSYIYGNAFNLIANRFLMGLILGILYEKTCSLYPSMICHGTINYLAIILWSVRI